MIATGTLALGLIAVSSLASPPPGSRGAGFDDVMRSTGEDVERWWEVSGVLRVRESLRYNLDLDAGLLPSGSPIYPTHLSDLDAQLLDGADMRVRVDLGAHTPGGGLAVHLRLDVLDNLALGSAPEGIPSASSSQRPSDSAMRVKRAYGIALTPFGYIAAGRMGSHWGLGLLANGGDCPDCDSGDAVDRVAFITAIAGHLWALAYDYSWSGPVRPARGGGPVIDVDPTDDVHTLTLAMLEVRSDVSLERRRRADRTTVEYGAYVSHRWQDNDVPASYLPIAAPPLLSAEQVMHRGFRATAIDGWCRVTTSWMRLELETAVLIGSIEQASLIPGLLLNDSVESLQVGVAFESEFGPIDGDIFGGLDAGYASGDPAPGFGALPKTTDPSPQPGDLDGAQAIPGRDSRVDNFRFHPDYRVDQILFREIIGMVTDAIYVRPHVDWRIAEIGPGLLRLRGAAILSFAADAKSTPGGSQPLGVELDAALEYGSRDGFELGFDYAVLFPLSGLDNAVAGISAAPAQLGRFRVSYAF